MGFAPSQQELITEGHLLKLRGKINRTRWFRLTTTTFSYYDKVCWLAARNRLWLMRKIGVPTQECGTELGSVGFENVASITLIGKREFVLVSTLPFTKSGQNSVHARCVSERARQKWATGFGRVVKIPPSTVAE